MFLIVIKSHEKTDLGFSVEFVDNKKIKECRQTYSLTCN